MVDAKMYLNALCALIWIGRKRWLEACGGGPLIAFKTWQRIRRRLDSYFRDRALKAGGIHLMGEGGAYVDIEDIWAAESAKQAMRAAYFVLSPECRPRLSPADVVVMRRSLDEGHAPTWIGHVTHTVDGRFVLELDEGACKALMWRDGDRIGFRRLFSGELLTYVERRAKGSCLP